MCISQVFKSNPPNMNQCNIVFGHLKCLLKEAWAAPFITTVLATMPNADTLRVRFSNNLSVQSPAKLANASSTTVHSNHITTCPRGPVPAVGDLLYFTSHMILAHSYWFLGGGCFFFKETFKKNLFQFIAPIFWQVYSQFYSKIFLTQAKLSWCSFFFRDDSAMPRINYLQLIHIQWFSNEHQLLLVYKWQKMLCDRKSRLNRKKC